MEDFIMNGAAHGNFAARLFNSGMDLDSLRPYTAEDGKTYVTRQTGYKDNKPQYKPQLVTNAPATLLKDEWIYLDRTVREVARARLGAVGDVNSRGLRMDIPNGLGTTVLQYQTASDIGPATISMDGLRRGENDRPLYEIKNLPLPIIHKDFSYSMRDVLVSRSNKSGLDVTSVRLATIKVVEEVEKLLIGTTLYPSFGGGTIYGYTTYPDRILKTITNPTSVGWKPEKLLSEMLEAKELMLNNYQYGRAMVYTGLGWEKYLDNDYSSAKGDNTLRDRIKKINNIEDVKTLDYLTGYQMILVIMDMSVVRMVNVAPLRVIRWEEQGGMEMKFKVLMSSIPQFRSDYNGKTGLMHLNV